MRKSPAVMIAFPLLVLSLMIGLSCSINRVNAVYSGSIDLKTFDFAKLVHQRMSDDDYVARSTISGRIVWYDHYYKKKHVAQYGNVKYLVYGIPGNGYQTPATMTLFPLLDSNTDRRCHYYFDMYAASDPRFGGNESFGEEKMIIRNGEHDALYCYYIVLRMKNIDNRRTIRVTSRITGGLHRYEFITGMDFLRDFTIYNEDKDKKLITIYKGSYVRFSMKQPFLFEFR